MILEFTWSEALTGSSIWFSDASLESIQDLWWNHYRATSTALTGSLSMFPWFSIWPRDYSWNVWDEYNTTTDLSLVNYDITSPTAEILYNPIWTGATALDVIATLANFSEPSIFVTNNSWSLTHIFTTNWSFTFDFRDQAWNTWSKIATVSNINKNVPVITLNWSGIINIQNTELYDELGAIWSDWTDGTWDVSILSGSVTIGTLGTYYIDYIKVNSLGLTWSTTRTVNVIDTVAPTLSSTGIISLTSDNTPSFRISASELSTPSYSGSCSAWTWSSTIWGWNNIITFYTLADWLHDDCYMTLTDPSGNPSIPLLLPAFTVDTTGPVINYEQIKNVKDNSVDLELDFTEANMWGSSTWFVDFTDWGTSTWTADLTFSWNLASTPLSWLNEDTSYTYTVTLIDSLWNTRNSTGTFSTAKIIVLNTDLTETWAIALDSGEGFPLVWSWETYELWWNLFINSDPNDNDSMTWSLTLSWVNILVSSWSWDWVLIPPTLIDPNSDESATWSEVGTWVTIVQTIKTWSEWAWLSASGWYFQVSFAVPWYPVWTTFSLYRSENWSTWTLNTPDAHCTLDSDLMCTFRTDHLSFFAPWLDNEPDAFSFTALTDKELSTQYESNTITVAWIDTWSTITVTWWEYKIWTWSYTSATWTVNSWDTVTVRQTSSASYSTLKTATLTIGWVSANFNVTTKAASSGGGSGGGWSSWAVKDTCPNWDYSASFYDNTCWTKPTWTWSTSTDTWDVDDTSSNWTWDELTDVISETSWIFNNDLKICYDWEKLPFPDIANSWAKCYIIYLYKAWIIDGKEGNYLPQANTTRAEFIKMVLWASKIDYSKANTSTLKFDDVKKDSWQAKVVKIAIDNWLIDPNNKKFRPDESISRIEAIKILLLSMDLKIENNNKTNFTDINEDWMIKYVEASKNMWLIDWQTVNEKLIFRPLDSISRAESSKITVKFILINK